MAEPFLGEIRTFSFDFPPRGWALCRGQLLPINQNQALFSLLGTQFGGNGQTNFALPNLIDRVAAGFSDQYPMGSRFGEPAHSLGVQEMPEHAHALGASSSRATSANPSGNVFANPSPGLVNQGVYGVAADAFAEGSVIQNSGGGQPHENSQPYLTLSPCIALTGIYPSRD